MPRKSDSPISRHINKQELTNNGNIGFSTTARTVSDNVSREKAFSNKCNSDEDVASESSCDSCSELTEQYNKRKLPSQTTCKVNTYRPVVRFKVRSSDMDALESANHKEDIEQDLRKLSRKGTGSVRYTQPRLSLLGKPISYKMHKRDVRYRRLQAKIYNFLERPKVWYAFLYHIGICVICIGALVLSTLCTITEFEPIMTTTLLYTEPTLLLWLVTEYTIRIWASGCRSRYQGCQGRLRFAQRPLCIIDAVIILSTLLVIIVGSTSEMFAASTLRGLRFFQILRMVRIDRRAATWKLLASVIWAHRRELLTTVYIGILGLLFSSYLVYLAEKDYHSTKFATFADALWWGVVTLCTVGYGDVVPDTWAGKLIASFSATLGIAFFALPAGILGSGFALKVQQQQRQKHLIRRRVPAALLIQSLWRCYAADEYSISIATWKPHMIPCPSPTTERPFKNNASFVSRFSTRRKDRGANSNNNSGNVSPHSPMVPRRDRNKLGSCSEEEVPDTLQSFVNRTWSHLSLATGLVDQRVDRIAMLKETNNSGSFCSKDQQDGDDSDHTSGSGKYNLKPFQSEDEPDLSPKIRDLTSQEKKAIRALRKIKYFVARKKFREALRPYDVKDVIEQYSAGHVDMLSRVKCLQFRLDQILGKSGSKNKDVYESKVSLSSRIVKVERQVEDIESKLDLLIDLYKDDRRVLLQQHTTNQDTNATETQSAKPRSILIDKQYVSEPSTPILEKHPSKVMLRNHSDLSSRIRKRVTYRLQTPAKSSVPQESRDADNLTNRKPELECRQLESIKSYSVDNDVIDAEGSDVFANQNDAISSAEAEITNTDKSECSPVFENDYSNSPITIDERKPLVKVKLNETRQGRCDDFDQSSIMEDDHVIDKQPDEQTTSVRNGVNTHDVKSNAEVTNTGDHVILMPIGTMQALAADSSDV